MMFEKGVYWLLVFLLPAQLAYHFWPDYSFVFGIKVDYLSPAVYLTDILVFLLAAISYQKLKDRINRKLITKKSRVVLIKLIIVTALIVFANITVAKEAPVALLKWIKIFEMLLLGVYVFLNKRFQKATLSAFFYSILFFCSVGIAQFVLQKTIGGPFYLLGERSFSVTTPGIALTSLLGRDFLRSYSTFPHPNAFAGFLGAGVALVLLLNSQLKIFSKKKIWLFILVSLTAFLLTFSLGAIISGMLTLLCYFVVTKKIFYCRPQAKTAIFKSWMKLESFLGIKNNGVYAIAVYAVVFLSLLMTVPQKLITNRFFLPESVTLRIQQAGIAGKMFINNPLFGVGLNNFIPSVSGNIVAGTSLFLQPVHNIYLLLLTEAGMVGFAVFVYLTGKLLTTKINIRYLLPIFFVILTGFFDHYWFTLQQNQLLLALLLGVSLWKK